MKIKYIKFLLYITLFYSLKCYIILPFKIQYNEKDTFDESNFNANYFINEYNHIKNKITIQISDKKQKVTFYFTVQDCGLYIGKFDKCDINSFYNKNISLQYKKTNYYQRDSFKARAYYGNSAEDSFFLYDDINIFDDDKNIQNANRIVNLGFYLGSDTTENVCGIIGLRFPGYCLECDEVNNIFQSLKQVGLIQKYLWSPIYTSEEGGILLFGERPDKIFNSLNKKSKLYKNLDDNIYDLKEGHLNFVASVMSKSDYPYSYETNEWKICFTKIYLGNTTEISSRKCGILTADINLIVGSNEYYEKINETYFDFYFKKNICKRTIEDSKITGSSYVVIYCDKKGFTSNDIIKIPKLSLIHSDLNVTFSLESQDLFLETKDFYYFKIIFDKYKYNNWYFGKTFLKKYNFVFDYDNKLIGTYQLNQKKLDLLNKTKSNNFVKVILYIFIGLIILSIVLILGYIIGKRTNLKRKLLANELEDNYEYKASNKKLVELYN